MKVLDGKVIELLKKEPLWWIGTYSNEPNVVPVGFKEVADDGKLVVGDVFLNHTLKNIEANGKVVVSAGGSNGMVAYQIKGTAVHVTEGPFVEKYKKVAEEMFKGQVSAKGALIITPEKVIVASPGPKNNLEM